MSILDSSNQPATQAYRDPITGAAGSHPVGTGVGAVLGGAAAGAAAATAVGPVGTVIGAVVGAVVGGLAGKSMAESADPTCEDAFWRENFSFRPYIESGSSYIDYGPAYGYGVRSFGKHQGRSFDDAEADLARDWPAARGVSSLGWDRARSAARDAWDRVGSS